ncbi:MAG: prepilin-type N-terminal cleavage/methylation domain-containing protein [Gloeobacteraceae cyanobacterium ES-bin-144]|nr:prepilin-type N-terminal cleavage/methylation domain-containing protein [Verrucomicrobiales bacterium]
MAWKAPQMISAVKTTNTRHGFTLIEMVVVLAIAAVIMGGAVGAMVYSSDERVLRNASGEIELLAKRARTTAILQQTPYALEFRQGIVRLLPLAMAGRDEKKTAGGHRIGGEPVDDGFGERWEYQLEGGMKVSIRHWNSTKWLETEKNTVHVWRFDPSGLSEPISVRLSLENSWAEDTYHPLTATIRDSQLEAR